MDQQQERLGRIVAALNGYQGEDIWRDVIETVPEFDRELTDEHVLGCGDPPSATECSERSANTFFLNDGTVFGRDASGSWICITGHPA